MSPPPSIALSSTLASPNPFAVLSPEPEYSPLAYIDVDIKAAGSGEWRAARAMVDCGGQGSFINDNLLKSYKLPRLPKQQTVSLVLADGLPSKAGHITHYNPLVLRTAGNEELLGLDIAPTSHDIILGMPWLKRHDPAIRFGSNCLTFDSQYCQENCAHHGQTIPLHQAPHITGPSAQLGEERRNERDGPVKVLPPRNPSEVSRNEVSRKSLSIDAVDEARSSCPTSEEEYPQPSTSRLLQPPSATLCHPLPVVATPFITCYTLVTPATSVVCKGEETLHSACSSCFPHRSPCVCHTL